jgi:hypothetical protein
MGKDVLKTVKETAQQNEPDADAVSMEAVDTYKPGDAMKLPVSSEIGNIPVSGNSSGSAAEEHGVCTAAGQINYLTDGLLDLRARLLKLEAAVLSMENQTGNSNGSRDTSKSTMQQINNVARQIESVTEGLRTTPDYNLGKIFSCASCNSNGTIAIKVMCTSCGKENWWGYWPKKNSTEK